MGRWVLLWQTAIKCVLGSCLVAIVGCASLEFLSGAPFTPVWIEHVSDVAGRWEGAVKGVKGYKTVWVTVDITSYESYTTYTFVGAGREMPFLGTGRVQLLGGRLLNEDEGRTLTLTLAEQSGAQVLLVTGIGKDGASFHAELKRAN
jgi:hypothetical protein